MERISNAYLLCLHFVVSMAAERLLAPFSFLTWIYIFCSKYTPLLSQAPTCSAEIMTQMKEMRQAQTIKYKIERELADAKRKLA